MIPFGAFIIVNNISQLLVGLVHNIHQSTISKTMGSQLQFCAQDIEKLFYHIDDI